MECVLNEEIQGKEIAYGVECFLQHLLTANSFVV